MGIHDVYGKKVIERAAGPGFDGSRAACRVAYPGPDHQGAFVDGTAYGIVAIEVESRTNKQVRGALLDLIMHDHPKKLLVLIKAYSTSAIEDQCRHALGRYCPAGSHAVTTIDGSGFDSEGHMAKDVETVRTALQALIADTASAA